MHYIIMFFSVLCKKNTSFRKCLSKIDASAPDDLDEYWITGMAFVDSEKLLLADRNNGSLKEVNIFSNTVTGSFPLAKKLDLWDLTLMTDSVVAVTLSKSQMIKVIKTEDFSQMRTIKVDGECRGICSSINNFFVTFIKPGRTDVIDFEGTLIATVSHDTNGCLFTWPEYVTVSSEGNEQVVYVSDYLEHSLTKLSFDGKVIAVFKDINWRELAGVTSKEDGTLLVSNSANNKILAQSKDKIETLLDTEGDLCNPLSLVYKSDCEKLFVSSNVAGRPINVYHVGR